MYSFIEISDSFPAIDNLTERNTLDFMDWVDRTKARLKQLKKKQSDLIPVLGVKTHGAVGHYMSRRQEPSMTQLQALCEFLGCGLEWLVTGRGQAPDEPDTMPLTSQGRELAALVAVAEKAIIDFEREHDIEFTDDELWNLLYEVVDFAAKKQFSEEFVKQYTKELAKKAKNET